MTMHWNDVKSFFNVQNTLILLSILCAIFLIVIFTLLIILIRFVKKKRFYQHQSAKIARRSNEIPTETLRVPSSTTPTQSFDQFENELKRTWKEKTNEEEVETVNEVLGMEERNGKVYYKVNFTGHPPDYTAWVCEEDLIPE